MKSTLYHLAFHQDGSLRDIYVQNVTVHDWEKFLKFVRSSGFGLRYLRDGETAQLPSNAADVLADRSCAHNLIIDVGGVGVCCHFFIEDEIELDIDPREVTSQAALDNVMNFMRGLGAYLARDVILTEENSPEYVWFRYSSGDGVVRYERTV